MIKYKINVLEELKKAGYNSTIIREKNLLSQGTVQNIKEGKIVRPESLDKLCYLLNCQPGDILKWEIDKL